jgi:inositol 1,4,5-triphosphate receptor type 1/inositol 1,4,5-triphosphate receptor type 3
MISGLIVDTFSSLRKEQEEFDQDLENVCFICGLERDIIERYYIGKDGFNKHLEDHNVAMYFFFIFYLKEKETGELTGIESYVQEMIEKENLRWFPIERYILLILIIDV